MELLWTFWELNRRVISNWLGQYLSSKAFLYNLLKITVPMSGGIQDETCQVNLIRIGMTNPPDEVLLCGKKFGPKWSKIVQLTWAIILKLLYLLKYCKQHGYQIFVKVLFCKSLKMFVKNLIQKELKCSPNCWSKFGKCLGLIILD